MGPVFRFADHGRNPSSSGGTIITPYFGEWGENVEKPHGICHGAAVGVSPGNLVFVERCSTQPDFHVFRCTSGSSLFLM